MDVCTLWKRGFLEGFLDDYELQLSKIVPNVRGTLGRKWEYTLVGTPVHLRAPYTILITARDHLEPSVMFMGTGVHREHM